MCLFIVISQSLGHFICFENCLKLITFSPEPYYLPPLCLDCLAVLLLEELVERLLRQLELRLGQVQLALLPPQHALHVLTLAHLHRVRILGKGERRGFQINVP